MRSSDVDHVAYCLEPGLGHVSPGHPESPGRFEFFDELVLGPLESRMRHVETQPASLQDALSVHSSAHMDRIENAVAHAPSFLDYGDTYVTRQSLQMALRSAGGVLDTLRMVMDGHAPVGFAFTRPPGHHATSDQAMGFCLLNNIAIATRAAQASGAQRIAIVDFDVHHGNGTQAIFDADPNVLYVSTHQYGIYPGTGALTERGTGPGMGTSINLPFPALAGDEAFEQATERVIAPAIVRHRPDLLLVSAGFDAHWRDPLAGLQVTGRGYGRLAARLRELALLVGGMGPVFCLEGGYQPEALAHSVKNTLRATLELDPEPEPWQRPDMPEPDVSGLLDAAVDLHGL